MFTGDEYADGSSEILATLTQHNIKASFFLTGNFYRNKANLDFISKAKENGHYLGAHSDQHLLYNDWSLYSLGKEDMLSISHFRLRVYASSY